MPISAFIVVMHLFERIRTTSAAFRLAVPSPHAPNWASPTRRELLDLSVDLAKCQPSGAEAVSCPQSLVGGQRRATLSTLKPCDDWQTNAQ